MPQTVPGRSYTIPALIPAANLTVWLLDRFISAQSWIRLVPWGLLWGLAAAFLLGLLMQDIFYNRRSWFWNRWHYLTDSFDCDLWINELADPERLTAFASLRFRRNIKAPRLALLVYRPGIKRADHIIRLPELGPVHKDERRQIELATIAISYPGWTPFYSHWGPPPHAATYSITGPKNIVVVEIEGVWPRQQFRVFAGTTDYGGLATRPNFYAFTEREPPFELGG